MRHIDSIKFPLTAAGEAAAGEVTVAGAVNAVFATSAAKIASQSSSASAVLLLPPFFVAFFDMAQTQIPHLHHKISGCLKQDINIILFLKTNIHSNNIVKHIFQMNFYSKDQFHTLYLLDMKILFEVFLIVSLLLSVVFSDTESEECLSREYFQETITKVIDGGETRMRQWMTVLALTFVASMCVVYYFLHSDVSYYKEKAIKFRDDLNVANASIKKLKSEVAMLQHLQSKANKIETAKC